MNNGIYVHFARCPVTDMIYWFLLALYTKKKEHVSSTTSQYLASACGQSLMYALVQVRCVWYICCLSLVCLFILFLFVLPYKNSTQTRMSPLMYCIMIAIIWSLCTYTIGFSFFSLILYWGTNTDDERFITIIIV